MRAVVDIVPAETRLGAVWDVDGTAWVTGPRALLRALLRNAYRTRRGRRPVHGVATLLRGIVEDEPHAPVVYLSSGPEELTGQVTRFPERNGFPRGSVLMRAHESGSPRARHTGPARKRAAIEQLMADAADVRWIPVGDVDPQLLSEVARQHPDRVAAVVLRSTGPRGGPVEPAVAQLGPVSLVRGADAAGLLPRLRGALGLASAGGSAVAEHDWFLTQDERGNPATRLRAWTAGNAARALVHGSSYFDVLADELAGTGSGDAVLFSGWIGDGDERLRDGGPTVGAALAGAARAGAAVKGLLWRSHVEMAGYSLQLMREHLERDDGDDADLLDPDDAAAAVRASAAALDGWHEQSRRGPRPRGRLRRHDLGSVGRWQRLFAVPAYRLVADPDGRSLRRRGSGIA